MNWLFSLLERAESRLDDLWKKHSIEIFRATTLLAFAVLVIVALAGPYDAPDSGIGITWDSTLPADSESAQYGAGAIRQIKRQEHRTWTNEHYATGQHKTNFITGAMFGTNVIPAYAFISNSIPQYAITNVSTVTGASLQRYRTNITSVTTNSTVFARGVYYITNGTELARVTLTPRSSNDVIVLRSAFHGQISGTGNGVLAMFRLGVTNRLAYTTFGKDGNSVVNHFMEIEDSPVTTNSVTYTLRVGPYKSAGTVYANINPDGDNNTDGATFFEAQEWITP